MKGPNWGETVALFGGTFDPPHMGHRMAAQGLLREPGVKRVLILPSPAPPHKPTLASADERIAMAKLNFQGMEIDPCEIERARRDPSRPAYTFDTLQDMRSQVPEAAFVIGADQLAKLPTWHRFPEVLTLSHWIVLERHPNGGDVAQATLREWKASGLVEQLSAGRNWAIRGSAKFLTVVPTDAPALSSTDIRESISRNGQPVVNTLIPEVLAYLKTHRLYGMTRGSK